jgi:hypothetical protein
MIAPTRIITRNQGCVPQELRDSTELSLLGPQYSTNFVPSLYLPPCGRLCCKSPTWGKVLRVNKPTSKANDIPIAAAVIA